jgi:YVTN family beta-propeller protein
MMPHRLLLALVVVGVAGAADREPLELEAKIPLGDVHGRIDHMAIDPARRRLYVAELGNDSVGVIDLRERKVLRTIRGLKEPQGVGYVASTDTLYVANAGDGTVRLYQGADLTPAGQISLGDDADNVRVDDAAHRLFVGYGSGALAVIDTMSRQKIADIRLKAHPESFQLESSGQHIFVNVPDAREIAVVHRPSGTQVTSWSTDSLRANFPMALHPAHSSVISVFRHPAALGEFQIQSGQLSLLGEYVRRLG